MMAPEGAAAAKAAPSGGGAAASAPPPKAPPSQQSEEIKNKKLVDEVIERAKMHLDARSTFAWLDGLGQRRQCGSAQKESISDVTKTISRWFLLNVHPDKCSHPHCEETFKKLHPMILTWCTNWSMRSGRFPVPGEGCEMPEMPPPVPPPPPQSPAGPLPGWNPAQERAEAPEPASPLNPNWVNVPSTSTSHVSCSRRCTKGTAT